MGNATRKSGPLRVSSGGIAPLYFHMWGGRFSRLA